MAAEAIGAAAAFEVLRSGSTQRAVKRGHQVGAENIGLIKRFVYINGGLAQIGIIGQRLINQRIQLRALIHLPPIAVDIVALGGFGGAHHLAAGGQREARVGFMGNGAAAQNHGKADA